MAYMACVEGTSDYYRYRGARRGGIGLKMISVAMATCLLSLAPASAAFPEQRPKEAIKGTVAQLRSILDEFQEPSDTEARRWEIEQVIRQRVHYQEMAKRSLGTSWSQLNDDARQEYVGLFVQLLRDALANKIADYSAERVSYLSEQKESGCAEVKTRLLGNKVDTFIDFRLSRVDGQWLIYDAVMDGTSLVGDYRAQFARIIRVTSPADLINRMKEQTLIVKLFEMRS